MCSENSGKKTLTIQRVIKNCPSNEKFGNKTARSKVSGNKISGSEVSLNLAKQEHYLWFGRYSSNPNQ